MGAYFSRLTRLVLALVVLTIVGHAQAYATWASVKVIKKVKGGSNKAFKFSIVGGGRWSFGRWATLDPRNGSATSRWYCVEAGTITVTQSLTNGVKLTSVSCRRVADNVVWKTVRKKVRKKNLEEGRHELGV